MTDNHDAFDELVSRYLDAEATPDEVARVESDPALLARADDMRAAIAALDAPIEIPTADLDRIRAAAIAESTMTTSAVTDLANRRRTLERRNRIIAVAAAFVFVAVGFAAVQNLSTGDEDSADAGAPESEATSASESASASASEMAEEDSATALEMFGDDTASATMDEADMAESADMADDEMADMAEEAAEAESVMEDDEGESATRDIPLPERRPGFDVLPDFLGSYGTVDEIAADVTERYALLDVDPGSTSPSVDEVFQGVCDDAFGVLSDLLGADVVSIETAVAELDGQFVSVNVAIAGDGGIVVYLHPAGDCPALEIISPELP